jgi:hypothetical protein
MTKDTESISKGIGRSIAAAIPIKRKTDQFSDLLALLDASCPEADSPNGEKAVNAE